MQSQIAIQACSGLNTPLLQTRPNSCSTSNLDINAMIYNSHARMTFNAPTARSLDPEPLPQLDQRQRKVLASSDLNLSKVKNVQDIL